MNEPVSNVVWMPREELTANTYNPNHVAPSELALLRLSILTDGWTQPIVARADREIVDGYHRWLVSGDQEVAARTGGRVPVVFLRDDLSPEDQVAATIRHNRARGVHTVLPMADIVIGLRDAGWDVDRIGDALGMEFEEVDRLLDRGRMTKRGRAEDMGRAWFPG